MPRSLTVLGLKYGGSEPAACLLVGGQVVACAPAASSDSAPGRAPGGFPAEAVQHCLEAAATGAEQVDHVAYVEPEAPGGPFQPGQGLPASFARHFGLAPDRSNVCFHRVEVRRAMLASAFYSSPWDAAAVSVIGGSGGPAGAVWGAGFDTALALAGDIAAAHSPAQLAAALARHFAIEDPGRLESRVLHLIRHLALETGLERLCLTGGAARTPGLVDRIREETPFREIYVPPRHAEASAAGAAVGAALDLWHRGLAFPRAHTARPGRLALVERAEPPTRAAG